MPKNFNPEFVQTPANPTTQTWGWFAIGLQHGGWGSDTVVLCTCEGNNTIGTYPQGSADFAIQFDNCPVGMHTASFDFREYANGVTGAQKCEPLTYTWEVTA